MGNVLDHYRFADAVESQSIDKLREMLAAGYDVNSIAEYNDSHIDRAMPHAIAKADPTVLRVLWEAKATAPEDSLASRIFQEFASGGDAVSILTKERQRLAAQKPKKRKAKEREITYSDSDSPEANFSTAVLYQDAQKMRTMLSEGFQVNDPLSGTCPYLETASVYAGYAADPSILRILWEAGAKAPPTGICARVFADFDSGGDGFEVLDPGGRIRAKNKPGKKLRDLADNFSVKKLKAAVGTLILAGGDSVIEIPIEPFGLDGETVETSIRLESIRLPDAFEAIEGKTFSFPVNPEEGYIDGSVYLRDVHNPVDVTRIQFGRLEGESLLATLTMAFNFEFESIGFDNETRRWKVPLKVKRS